MTTDERGPLGSECNAELGPLVVAGVIFEPMRIPVPQIAEGLPKEVHVFSRAMMEAAVAAERERWQRELGECTGALQTVEREAAMWEERARHLGWRDEHGA